MQFRARFYPRAKGKVFERYSEGKAFEAFEAFGRGIRRGIRGIRGAFGTCRFSRENLHVPFYPARSTALPFYRPYSRRCTYDDDRRGATTSLPEQLGDMHNWDYRYCWLRDATFTLYSLLSAGFHEEAQAWREWLPRAVAGGHSQLQIMYGLARARRLDEYEVKWLPGCE